MENAIALKEATPLATQSVLEKMGISMNDIIIPRLMLMQNTSEAVGAGSAKLGDIVSSLTEEVLGGIDKPVSFIPISTFKTWMVYDISGASPKFVRSEPSTKANEGRPWEAMENGLPHRYNHVINCLALLRKDCATEEAFPVLISFKRTSFTAGRAFLTQLLKQQLLRRENWAKAYWLNTAKTKNETNYYAVLNVTPDSATTIAEQEMALMWAGMLSNTSTYKLDEDRDLKDETPRATAPDVVLSRNNGEELPC
jgi:hypothetical protein